MANTQSKLEDSTNESFDTPNTTRWGDEKHLTKRDAPAKTTNAVATDNNKLATQFDQAKNCVPVGLLSKKTFGTNAVHNTPAGFNAPSDEDCQFITTSNIDSNRVMNDEMRKAIDSDLAEVIKDSMQRAKLYMTFALALVDSGSSPSTVFDTRVVINGTCVELDDLAKLIQKHTTLRQFGRFYAKMVYQYMRKTNRPPENWLGKGYPYECRFAAFDFFDGVSSNESLEPRHGFRCLPSTEEIRINNTNKNVQIRRRNNLALASTLMEVTGGKSCPTPLSIGGGC